MAISLADGRPRFETVVRASSYKDELARKERQFQEWKKRNQERMRRANVKAKVYEFARPPQLLEQESPDASSTPVPAHDSRSTVRKLAPIQRTDKDSSADSSAKSLLLRRKRLTKSRQRERPSPKLKKIVHHTSSSDEDSGVSFSRRLTGKFVGKRPGHGGGSLPLGLHRQDFESTLRELIRNVVDQSICEVTHEERHCITGEDCNFVFDVGQGLES